MLGYGKASLLDNDLPSPDMRLAPCPFDHNRTRSQSTNTLYSVIVQTSPLFSLGPFGTANAQHSSQVDATNA